MVDTNTLQGILAASAGKPVAAKPVNTNTLEGIAAASGTTVSGLIGSGAGSTATTTSGAPAVSDPMLVGITEAMVNAHPELAKVRSLYIKGDYAGALNALYDTDFFKNTSSQVLANEQLQINQPGVYEDTIKNQWIPALRKYAIQNGLVVSDNALDAISRQAFKLGLTPSAPATLELFSGKNSSGQNYVTGIAGGLAAQTKNNLASLNYDYGTNFNQSWLDSAATSIAEGKSTEQFWSDQIKKQAVDSNPAWAEQLNAGLTLKQIASPYINTYANILGIDAASISLNDNLLKRGLQGADPTKPAAMPLWEFEKAVRQDPRWATSKDAMDQLSNVGYNLAKSWGVVG